MSSDVENVEDVDEFLAHFGVKGMRWGQRSGGTTSTQRKTDREAGKDAAEFTKAKMYYGEGAGIRRRLIKAKVEAKSAKDPAYKDAFDKHVANTDMSERAQKARGERKRTDVKNTTKKTAKGIGHMIKGNPQYATLLATGIFAGAVAAHKMGVDKMLLDKGMKAASSIAKSPTVAAAKAWIMTRGQDPSLWSK